MAFLPDDNLAFPVLIKLENGATGSGFFLRADDVFYLVTAKHVLFGQDKTGTETLHSPVGQIVSYSRDLKIKEALVHGVNFAEILDEGNLLRHATMDVAIVKIATLDSPASDGGRLVRLIKHVVQTKGPTAGIVGVPKENFRHFDGVGISNDVFVMGYPNSLGMSEKERAQIDKERPLLRKGIVAGKNEKNRTIILDCPVYYGNSGGIVVEIEPSGGKIWPIGIVSEYVPFVEKLLSLQHRTINTNIENSGYSIAVPIDTILDMIDIGGESVTSH